MCDKYHAIHAQVYEWFNIKFDQFGRTSAPGHREIAQDIFTKVHEAGYTLEQDVTQLHCGSCDKGLADRLVEGTCPKCGSPGARGDQCDKCSNLLDPMELIDPVCKVCGATPQPKVARHVFLDLPKVEERLQGWLEENMEDHGWSIRAAAITRNFIKQGLLPRCITRDLKWGTPVPLEEYSDKVLYVWFDAPIGYISITAAYAGDKWEEWWKAPSPDAAGSSSGGDKPPVEIRQYMGKDNVTFHAIIFPSTLMAANEGGDSFGLVHSIDSTDYLQYEDAKFSKSRGTGVFGDNVQTTGIPPAVWRYALLSSRPEKQDSAFLWDEFVTRTNNELVANPGNFVNRVLKFTKAKCDGVVPPLVGELTERDVEFESEVNAFLGKFLEAMEASKLKLGLKLFMEISSAGNRYIHDVEPWKVFKADPERAGSILHVCINFIYLLASLVAPFMPSISSNILHQLGLVDTASPSLADELHPYIPDLFSIRDSVLLAGHVLGAPTVLFEKLSEDIIEVFRAKFGGAQVVEGQDAGPSSSSPDGTGAPPAGAVPGAVALDEAELRQALTAQGNTVRILKSPESGASKEEVDAAVSVLLYLKKVLALVTGDDGKKKKKKKKNGGAKNGGKGGKGGGKPKRVPQPVDACPIDLVVGRVVEAVAHPDSEKLLIMQVDLGEEAPRQICGGLAKDYAPEALVGKSLVFLANLKPAKLGGEVSDGMLLAAVAAGEEGKESVAVLVPEGGADVAPGTRVVGQGQVPRIVEGYARIKKSKLKKVKMVTLEDGGVAIDTLPLVCVGEGGVRIVPDPGVEGIGPNLPVC